MEIGMISHKILIVDDEQNVRRALRRTLESGDFSVTEAESASEAMQALRNEEIDLIISDQNMPVKNGIDFLEETITEFPDVIRILLTGYADMDTAIRAVNSGCVYKFLLKPWQNDELLVTVRRALEQRRLVFENRDLTEQLKMKDAILQELEKKHPGITEKSKNKVYQISG